MDQFIELMTGREATAFANATSVISFILTIAVFVGVRRIRKFYIFTARVPDLNGRLSDLASKISSQLNSGSTDSTAITEILADVEVTLKSLIRKVGNPLKSSANKIIKEIRSLDHGDSFIRKLIQSIRDSEDSGVITDRETKIRNIYIALYKLSAECKEIYEDARWEQ